MARPPTYRDEELLEKALKLQEDNPLFSETAICGLLKVGREYLADRAKESVSIRELRSIMAAIRQGAWEQAGIELIKCPGKETNPIIFIWQTRNTLGWRNEPEKSRVIEVSNETKQEKPMTPAEYAEILRGRQKPKDEAP